MKLVPGLKEVDIAAFGSALTEIQDIVGGHFAQTGRQRVDQPRRRTAGASRMRDLGATGIGQSSWGPTGFAFVDSPNAEQNASIIL